MDYESLRWLIPFVMFSYAIVGVLISAFRKERIIRTDETIREMVLFESIFHLITLFWPIYLLWVLITRKRRFN